MERRGGRHERVREDTYKELLDERKTWEQQLEESALQTEAWLHDVDQLAMQCEQIVREMPPEHAPAIRALQEALLDMVADGEDADGDDECSVCEPEPTEPSKCERVATAFFEQVAEELAWTDPTSGGLPPLAVLGASYDGVAGGLILTPYQLMWVAEGCHFSQARVRVPLGSIRQQRATLLRSPFGNRAEFTFATHEHASGSMIRFPCGSQLAAVEAFAREVAMAMEAIPGGAAATSSTVAAAVDATVATAAVPCAPVRRQTKQVLAAADLRAKLKEVVKLQRSHAEGSTAKATAILEGLGGADPTVPSIHTVYKASEHLRDVALGVGGYALVKRVIEQFLNMPSVKLMLPDDVRERQGKMADAKHAVELMGYAKEFFTGIFGVGFRGGRRSDEDRNAYAAASAAFLPRDLFAKRGRAAAAARLSGLGYRQLHRGSDQRRELEDRACGWRRVRTAEHKDKVNYGPLNDFWHSDLASTEDNQNKYMVRVFLGRDPETKEMLYDLHPRRAATCTLRAAVDIFRASEFGGRICQTSAASSKTGTAAVVGRRQLALAKCPCVKERKASQCDCEKCTQITLSLARFHRARTGWHSAFATANGGKACSCALHDFSSQAAASAVAETAALKAASEVSGRQADAAVWERLAPELAPASAAAAAVAAAMEAMTKATAAATEAAVKLAAAKQRVERYARMSQSEEALMAALLPCGKRAYPEQTVGGEKVFKCYDRACCEDNCPNKGNLFERRKGSACGYALVFEGFTCPVDNSDDEFVWQRWEKMLRNANKDRETDDGKPAKPSYSLELVPHQGTRGEFIQETFGSSGHVRRWLPHKRRIRWCRQGRRLFEEHKSGAREAAAADAVAVCQAALEKARARAKKLPPPLAALQLIAKLNPWLNFGVVAAALAPTATQLPPSEVAVPAGNGANEHEPAYAVVFDHRRIPLTLAALVSVITRDEANTAAAAAVAEAEAALTVAQGKTRTAAQVHELARLTMTVQSDYASQVQIPRIHTATCAQPERHNLLVSIVGYKPYTEQMKKVGRSKKNPKLEPVRKQHVDVFYAFHKAGFKPSARSFNVVQEDIDHWMIHGSFLHGEWFLEGQRCPGGDHREALPAGLTERPHALADFPEMRQRLDIFDGCPNQFAYGDNFYQVAVWRAKTAQWAKHRLAAAADAAAASTSTAATVAATTAVESLAAATRCLNVVNAAARGMPLARSQLSAISTVHRLAGAVTKAAEKLAFEATKISANPIVGRETPILSAATVSQNAVDTTTAVRIAQAASKAADAAADAAEPTGLKAPLLAVVSAVAGALAAASASAAAAAAASDAINPASPVVDVNGDGGYAVPLSPSAAAAIAAAPALDGIVRLAIKLVEHHGKSACDGNSNTISHAIKAAIEHKLLGPNPGTRQLVLYLAKHKPLTLIPKSDKRGWEAIGRIFYGFMNTDLFTKTIIPDTDGSKFTDSTKHHSFVGRITSGQVFTKGEMQACHEFCPCSDCLLGHYASCKLRTEMGTMHRVAVPWVSGSPLRQLEELSAWGEMLKPGMVVAFTADKNDKGEWPLEGNYYLALLQSRAYPVPESQVQATDRFEKGWLVVDAQWLQIVGDSPRSYKLLPEKRTLVVSEMIRLSTIVWDKIDKRSPRLGQTLYYLGEDAHNLIEAYVRDQDA